MIDLKTRVLEISNHIIKTKDTIRKTAKIYKVSKSTVHKDINERLRKIDYDKYKTVKEILNKHIETRHILGGQSTKRKYENFRKNNER